MRHVKKILKIIAIVLISLFLVLFTFLYINSRGVTAPFKNTQGQIIKNSIAEIKHLTIGGIKQCVLVRGKSKNNPLLLILHGGPGNPELPMFRKHNAVLENHFTVAYWDQRGTGKSVNTEVVDTSFTLEQFIADVHELTSYLKREYTKDKIFLLGHSWGSLLGIKAVSKFPEDYYAFIGTGQMVNQPKSDSLSFEFIKASARKLNDTKALAKLDEIGNYSKKNLDKVGFMNWLYYQRVLLSIFGGAIADPQKTHEVFSKPILFCNEYTLKEKWNLVKSNSQSAFLNSPYKKIIPRVLSLDISNIKNFQVPIYILQGEKDHITSYAVSLQYYNIIDAPKKQFYSFKNSAHFPAFEESEKFNTILINDIRNDFKE